MKKKVILCPNPYRDSELKVAKDAKAILEGIGFETVVCLPFHRDGYGDELGVPVRQLQQEIKSADLMIAFGGDGTILHLAKTVAMNGTAQRAGAGHQSGQPGLHVGAGGQRAGAPA